MMWFWAVSLPRKLKVGMTATGRGEAKGENTISLSSVMLGVMTHPGLLLGPPWSHRMQFLEGFVPTSASGGGRCVVLPGFLE